MIKIPWTDLPPKSKVKSHRVDVGDLRIILAERDTHWDLDFGIRVYTKDRSSSMVRPPARITTFQKPCTLDEAKALTEQYMEYFLSTITSAIETED